MAYSSNYSNTPKTTSRTTQGSEVTQTSLPTTKDLYINRPPTSATSTELTEIGKNKYEDNLQLKELTSKTITTSFGREEDYIELHVYNLTDQLLYSEANFRDYTTETSSPTSTSINIDPETILSNRGYTSGQYKLTLHIHRNKIFNSTFFPFIVREVSTSRREIKSVSEDVVNELFDIEINSFIVEIESAAYFKEFSLNFGGGVIIPAINLLLNTDPLKHELILKTLEPLPTVVNKNVNFKIVEELTDPISIEVDLGNPIIEDDSIELMGPNFQIDTRQNNSIPTTTFKTYDNLLQYNITSSYNHLLNKLENPDTINVKYDHIRNVSSSLEDIDIPYHFENFVHFSSAIERLKNFQYKLKLIESYNSEVEEIQLISFNVAEGNTPISTAKEDINKKKRNLIKGFDGYEHFLYFTSGSLYTWPKYTSTSPYELYSISSSEAINWLGNAEGTVPNYSGQMLSASLYDKLNENRLQKLIPEHIINNSGNNFYVSFINMVGQHFDHIWTYIKHLTEINNLDNKFGVSKELVYFTLKSLGIDTFDQFENTNLIEYILGEGLQNHSVGGLVIGEYIVGGLSNNFYNSPAGVTTYVTASNVGSIPKGDITKEIWKRLYNNAPYLLKTKGTERGLRALMNCYGIPTTILNVKEYGGNTLLSGPLKDLDTSGTYKTFSYDKSGLALKGESTNHYIQTPWSSSATMNLSSSAKTIEFRIKPIRSENNYHLFTLSGSNANATPENDLHLILEPYTSTTDISASNDTKQYGRLFVSMSSLGVGDDGVADITGRTGYFPIYNGDFWNIFIGTKGTSGSSNGDGDGTPVDFGAYQSNFLKHVTYYTGSHNWTIGDSIRATQFGDPYDSDTNNGGAALCFFGGVPANPDSSYDNIDGLHYSGSIQEIKIHYHTKGVYEMLSHETLKKHALEPFMYAGNSISSSYDELVLRLPLGSNDQQDSGSFHPNIDVNYLEFAGVGYSSIQSGFIVQNYNRNILSSMSSQSWEEVIETHHLPTPDTVGASMTSEKVRIDDNTISSDNILSVNKRTETSTLDRQPPDYEDLGIFFSPTSEINEDILYTLGSFRLDDYIGNPLPSAQSSSVYKDLGDIQEIYKKKLRYKYNYWDYIRTIQNFDHTLFKLIEQFVPFKANTKTGLLIEPTYLERTKFSREIPVRSDAQTMVTGSHQTINAQIGTHYSGNLLYSFSTSSQQTKRGFGYDKFPMAPGGKSASIGEYEPGSYIVSDNNLTFITSSKTSERLERGTNATIEIYDDHLNPFRRRKNRHGVIHSNNGQSCQSPIRSFVQRSAGVSFGIGAAAIGSSFTIGEWYSNGSGTPTGIEFSAVGETFTIGNYVGGSGTFTIGSATIGSTFVIGTYTNLPNINFNYKTHESNVLLGNAMIGRKSKKYFKYTTFTL